MAQRLAGDGVAGDGSRIAYSYTTNYDGKDSAISGVGFPNGADTIAVKRVDANTTTATVEESRQSGLDEQTRSLQRWEGHDHHGKRD